MQMKVWELPDWNVDPSVQLTQKRCRLLAACVTLDNLPALSEPRCPRWATAIWQVCAALHWEYVSVCVCAHASMCVLFLAHLEWMSGVHGSMWLVTAASAHESFFLLPADSQGHWGPGVVGHQLENKIAKHWDAEANTENKGGMLFVAIPNKYLNISWKSQSSNSMMFLGSRR